VQLRLDITDALVKKLASLDVETIRAIGGRKHVHARQECLTELVIAGYMKSRPHATNEDAISRTSLELESGLRTRRYALLLHPFFEFPHGNKGYSRDRRLTKPYRLRWEARNAVQSIVEGLEPVAVRHCDTNKIVQRTDLPSSGIPESLNIPFTVPSILPLALRDVDTAIETVKRWRAIHLGNGHALLNPEKGGSTTLDEALRLLYTARQWTDALGGIPNFLQEQSTGRLCPVQGSMLNVVNLSSRMRQLLLRSSGQVDYDIRSCLWVVFICAGHALGFKTTQAQSYYNDKSRWHQRLTELTGVRGPTTFKRVVLSWLTGGTLSSSPRTKSGALIGSSGMRALSEDPVVRSLYDEVRAGLKVLLGAAETIRDGKTTILLNALGLPLEVGKDGAAFGQQTAHLLFGFEQFIIRSMCSQVSGLQSVVYDGFVAPPQHTAPLIERAGRDTAAILGIPIRVELKCSAFDEPIPEPVADGTDF
jgi:hypothetical protein